MTTGYEVQFYNDIRQIAENAHRIASCLEAAEARARQQPANIDPGSLGAVALWQQDVAAGTTRLGFTDWMAWHERKGGES